MNINEKNENNSESIGIPLFCSSCRQIITNSNELCFFRQSFGGGIHLILKWERQSKVIQNDLIIKPQSVPEKLRISSHTIHCKTCNEYIGIVCNIGPQHEGVYCLTAQKVYFPSKETEIFINDSKNHQNDSKNDKNDSKLEYGRKWNILSSQLASEITTRSTRNFYNGKDDIKEKILLDPSYNDDISMIETKRPSKEELSMINPRELTLDKPRAYQIECFVASIQRNSILYLPTGSGKTLIAAMFIKFIKRYNQRKPVLMLLHRVPLVFQQSQYIRKQTGFDILTLCGENFSLNHLKRRKLLESPIIVCTAQILLNWIERGLFRLEDACAIIFDEIHNAIKLHPYAILLRDHFSKTCLDFPLYSPLILGLTASPVLGGDHVSMTLDLQNLLNLSKSTVYTPIIYRSNLEETVNRPQIAFFEVSLTGDQVMIRKLLLCYFDSIIGILLNVNFNENDHIHDNIQNDHIHDTHDNNHNHENNPIASFSSSFLLKNFREKNFKSSSLNDSDLKGLIRDLNDNIHQIKDKNAHGYLVHLSQVYGALEINSILGPKYVFDYFKNSYLRFKNFISKIAKKDDAKSNFPLISTGTINNFVAKNDEMEMQNKTKHESEMEIINNKFKNCLQKLKQYQSPSAKVEKLLELLKSSSREKKTKRLIIFVQTKKTARWLCQLLQDNDEILDFWQPAYFVGQSALGQLDGMSWNEHQEPILQKFRLGYHRLLISTSVLQEGLDVPLCNEVILFDQYWSLTSFVQTRGRARAEKSHFSLICSLEDRKRYEFIIKSEDDMQKAILSSMKRNKNPKAIDALISLKLSVESDLDSSWYDHGHDEYSNSLVNQNDEKLNSPNQEIGGNSPSFQFPLLNINSENLKIKRFKLLFHILDSSMKKGGYAFKVLQEDGKKIVNPEELIKLLSEQFGSIGKCFNFLLNQKNLYFSGSTCNIFEFDTLMRDESGGNGNGNGDVNEIESNINSVNILDLCNLCASLSLNLEIPISFELINKREATGDSIDLIASSIEFGNLINPFMFYSVNSIQKSTLIQVRFSLTRNLLQLIFVKEEKRNEMEMKNEKNSIGNVKRKLFRLDIEFAFIDRFVLISPGQTKISLYIPLTRAPFLFVADSNDFNPSSLFLSTSFDYQSFSWERALEIDIEEQLINVADMFTWKLEFPLESIQKRNFLLNICKLDSHKIKTVFINKVIDQTEQVSNILSPSQINFSLDQYFKNDEFEIIYELKSLISLFAPTFMYRITNAFFEFFFHKYFLLSSPSCSLENDSKKLDKNKLTIILDKLSLILEEKKRFTNIIHELEILVNKEFSEMQTFNQKSLLMTSIKKNENNNLAPIRLVIHTPSRMIFHKAKFMTKNRILRAFNPEYFIRVQFRDEDLFPISSIKTGAGIKLLLSEIYKFLSTGFIIANRHFQFLAMSSSQLRNHSCWFVAAHYHSLSISSLKFSLEMESIQDQIQTQELKGQEFMNNKVENQNDNINKFKMENNIYWINADWIRNWCGDFKNIKNVAKYIARLGQSLSASLDVITIPTHEFEMIPDVMSKTLLSSGLEKEYNFTDGIGMISESLARELTLAYSLNNPQLKRNDFIASFSAFQIRFAGFKGVVAINPFSNSNSHYNSNPFSNSNSHYNSNPSLNSNSNSNSPSPIYLNDNHKIIKSLSKSSQLWLRPSMKKFESSNYILEILNISQYIPCYLNRQILMILSCLGVEDEIFSNLQDQMLGQMSKMLISDNIGQVYLASDCQLLSFIPWEKNRRKKRLEIENQNQNNQNNNEIENQNNNEIENQNNNEIENQNNSNSENEEIIKFSTEPFFRSLLLFIYRKQLKGLLEKSHIFIPQGRILIGCIDETGTLNEDEVFIQCSKSLLDDKNDYSRFNCDEKRNLFTVTGLVAIAKNPCMHPGDLRVLKSVENPILSQFFHDCIVFPCRGKRPITDMCSGSDLDGDLYFVTWDSSLIPSKQYPPMNYSSFSSSQSSTFSSQSSTIDHDQTFQDNEIKMENIYKFITSFIENYNLGTIANAHVAHADQKELGIEDPLCLVLAYLFSLAVDFPKTGFIPTLPKDAKVTEWPDFMQKSNQPSYISNKILGRLFRKAKSLLYNHYFHSSNNGNERENFNNNKMKNEENFNNNKIDQEFKYQDNGNSIKNENSSNQNNNEIEIENNNEIETEIKIEKIIARDKKNSNSSIITPNPIFLYSGYEDYLENAQSLYRVYCHEFSLLANTFNIKNEAEIFTQVLIENHSNNLMSKEDKKEISEIVKRKLWTIFTNLRCQVFENGNNENDIEFENRKDIENNTLFSFSSSLVITNAIRAKASSWYHVAYTNPITPLCFESPILGFPWILGDVLFDIASIQSSSLSLSLSCPSVPSLSFQEILGRSIIDWILKEIEENILVQLIERIHFVHLLQDLINDNYSHYQNSSNENSENENIHTLSISNSKIKNLKYQGLKTENFKLKLIGSVFYGLINEASDINLYIENHDNSDIEVDDIETIYSILKKILPSLELKRKNNEIPYLMIYNGLPFSFTLSISISKRNENTISIINKEENLINPNNNKNISNINNFNNDSTRNIPWNDPILYSILLIVHKWSRSRNITRKSIHFRGNLNIKSLVEIVLEGFNQIFPLNIEKEESENTCKGGNCNEINQITNQEINETNEFNIFNLDNNLQTINEYLNWMQKMKNKIENSSPLHLGKNLFEMFEWLAFNKKREFSSNSNNNNQNENNSFHLNSFPFDSKVNDKDQISTIIKENAFQALHIMVQSMNIISLWESIPQTDIDIQIIQSKRPKLFKRFSKTNSIFMEGSTRLLFEGSNSRMDLINFELYHKSRRHQHLNSHCYIGSINHLSLYSWKDDFEISFLINQRNQHGNEINKSSNQHGNRNDNQKSSNGNGLYNDFLSHFLRQLNLYHRSMSNPSSNSLFNPLRNSKLTFEIKFGHFYFTNLPRIFLEEGHSATIDMIHKALELGYHQIGQDGDGISLYSIMNDHFENGNSKNLNNRNENGKNPHCPSKSFIMKNGKNYPNFMAFKDQKTDTDTNIEIQMENNIFQDDYLNNFIKEMENEKNESSSSSLPSSKPFKSRKRILSPMSSSFEPKIELDHLLANLLEKHCLERKKEGKMESIINSSKESMNSIKNSLLLTSKKEQGNSFNFDSDNFYSFFLIGISLYDPERNVTSEFNVQYDKNLKFKRIKYRPIKWMVCDVKSCNDSDYDIRFAINGHGDSLDLFDIDNNENGNGNNNDNNENGNNSNSLLPFILKEIRDCGIVEFRNNYTVDFPFFHNHNMENDQKNNNNFDGEKRIKMENNEIPIKVRDPFLECENVFTRHAYPKRFKPTRSTLDILISNCPLAKLISFKSLQMCTFIQNYVTEYSIHDKVTGIFTNSISKCEFEIRMEIDWEMIKNDLSLKREIILLHWILGHYFRDALVTS